MATKRTGKQRTHEFIIAVRFDEPCSTKHAIASVKDCIHGTHYLPQFNDGDPGEFKVAAIKWLPKKDG